jgi:hypothetical protein
MLHATKRPPCVSSRASPRMMSSSLAFQPPPCTMTMIGRLRAPFGRVDVVLQRLDARLRVDDVVRHVEVIDADSSMNDAPMRLFWSIGDLDLARHAFVVHLPESAGTEYHAESSA